MVVVGGGLLFPLPLLMLLFRHKYPGWWSTGTEPLAFTQPGRLHRPARRPVPGH